jgi:uncharacterized protein
MGQRMVCSRWVPQQTEQMLSPRAGQWREGLRRLQMGHLAVGAGMTIESEGPFQDATSRCDQTGRACPNPSCILGILENMTKSDSSSPESASSKAPAQSGKAQDWALVTGASSGIGAEFARLLAERGYPVMLVARREENLRRLAAEIEANHGVAARIAVSDLSLPGAAEGLWEEVEREGLRVSVLVNNAGFGDHGPVLSMEPARADQMMQLNIVALTLLTRLALPGMVERDKGYVLNVASTAAFQPGPFMAVYFATKAYVLSFTEALWSELHGSGVVATTLCPGPTESEFFDTANMGRSKLATRKLPSSREVADLGLRAMFAGKRTVVHGLTNRIGAAMSGIVPRGIVLGITKKVLQ